MSQKDQATIRGADFFKSIGKLEALAKGKAEENMEKSQLFHTGKNSEKTSWAGGDVQKYGDKWDDNIGKDGTDYQAARKSIAEKVMKGEALSDQELSILKGDLENAAGTVSKSAEEEKDMPGKEEKEGAESKEKSMNVQKSFEGNVENNETLQKGMEVSSFLSEFAKAFGSSLGDMSAFTSELIESATSQILEQVNGQLEERFAEQSQFNKSLAEALTGIANGIGGVIEQQGELASMPARAPKSQFVPANVKPLEKSFGGSAGADISKSMKLDLMCDMVQKGQLSPIEVTKFESTGQIRPDLDQKLIQMAQQASQQ